VGWLTFLSPPVVTHFSVELEVLGFAAEFSLMLWLLVRGIDGQRWTQAAHRAAVLPDAESTALATAGGRGQKAAG
jgi:hypothetical protein